MVPDLIYCIVFVMFYFFTIFPSSEMESAGITLEASYSQYLTRECGFVLYQIKAACVKFLIHSIIPTFFVLMIWVMPWWNPNFLTNTNPTTGVEFVWNVFCSFSFTLTVTAFVTVIYWSRDGYSNHPIAKRLHHLTSAALPDWRSVATNINAEYRRDTKMTIRLNANSTLVVTENWIIKTNLYVHDIAPRRDTLMLAYKIDRQEVITDTIEPAEFVNIAVRPSGGRLKPFTIRINGTHFRELQDHLQQTIVVLPSVKIRSLIERFVEVFKEQVAQNPTVVNAFPPASDENCLACLQAQPDVLIAKHCLDVNAAGEPLTDTERCQPCGCRPLWCVSCLATWFASQQQRFDRGQWLSQKTTCPMCRARFCVRDVCYVQNRTPSQTEE